MYYLEGNMVPTNMEYLFNKIKKSFIFLLFIVFGDVA